MDQDTSTAKGVLASLSTHHEGSAWSRSSGNSSAAAYMSAKPVTTTRTSWLPARWGSVRTRASRMASELSSMRRRFLFAFPFAERRQVNGELDGAVSDVPATVRGLAAPATSGTVRPSASTSTAPPADVTPTTPGWSRGGGGPGLARCRKGARSDALTVALCRPTLDVTSGPPRLARRDGGTEGVVRSRPIERGRRGVCPGEVCPSDRAHKGRN